MPDLDTIVSVTVTATTKTVSRAGFGVPMLLAYHTANLDTYRSYTKAGYPGNMIDDGHAATDVAVLAVGKIFSQSPSPTRCVVGRRLNPWTQTVEITPTPKAEGFVHRFTLTDQTGTAETYEVTEGAASTTAALCTALQAAIAAGSLAVTATDNTTEVEVAADNAGELFSYTAPTSTLAIADVTADAGVAADLAAVLAETKEFYGVCLDSGAPAENRALAAAAESQKVLFVPQEFDHGNLDAGSTTDTAYVVSNSAYSRTGLIFCHDALDFAGAALLGKCLPSDPGSITWAFKELAGVSADVLTTTQEDALLAKRGNSYTTVGGVNITYEGTTGSAYFDIKRTADWAEARVKESVFGGLVNAPKIPFTDQGGSILKALVLAPLLQGVTSGAFVAGTVYCNVPKVADILATDKAARNFTGITWGAQLAGAVHKVNLQGTLSI